DTQLTESPVNPGRFNLVSERQLLIGIQSIRAPCWRTELGSGSLRQSWAAPLRTRSMQSSQVRRNLLSVSSTALVNSSGRGSESDIPNISRYPSSRDLRT